MSNSNDHALIAIDISGSTGGSAFYWDTVAQIYNDLTKKKGEDNVVIIMWDSDVALVDKEELETIIRKREGRMGTYPDVVADFIVSNGFTGHLVLITDGLVSNVDTTESILKQHIGFSQVECHIINQGSHNLSVSCPFTRGINSFVYTHSVQEKKLVICVTEETKKLVVEFCNVSYQQFLDSYSDIESYVVSQTMGRSGNNELRNVLLNEKNRLIYEESKNKNVHNKFIKAIEDDNIENTKEFLKKFVHSYYLETNSKLDETVETKLQHLIDLCGDCRNTFDMGQIRSSRAARAKTVEKKSINDTAVSEIDEVKAEGLKQLIECPLSGEEDVGVLLICRSNILDGVPKNVVNNIINCPMCLVNYPTIVNSIKQSLGGVVGLKSIKENELTESPLTGEVIIGGIILSNNNKMTKIVNSGVATLFTREKLLGSPLYYLIAIYHIIQQLDDYKIAIPAFEKMLASRLQTSHSFASLSGKKQYVTTLLRTDLCFWYVLHSSLIELPPPNDPFLLHLSIVELLIKMTELVGWKVNPSVIRRFHQLQAMKVLHRMKFINSDMAECLIRALFQKAIKISRNEVSDKVASVEYFQPFIFIDGNADDEQISSVLNTMNPVMKNVRVDELLAINDFVHQRFRVSGTTLPLQLVNKKGDSVSVWNELKCGDIVLNIDSLKKKFKRKYEKEPTRDEFLLFIQNRLKTPTLPTNILDII
ncbi:VWFA domain-containing protein [Entamoeba marina]